MPRDIQVERNLVLQAALDKIARAEESRMQELDELSSCPEPVDKDSDTSIVFGMDAAQLKGFTGFALHVSQILLRKFKKYWLS